MLKQKTKMISYAFIRVVIVLLLSSSPSLSLSLRSVFLSFFWLILNCLLPLLSRTPLQTQRKKLFIQNKKPFFSAHQKIYISFSVKTAHKTVRKKQWLLNYAMNNIKIGSTKDGQTDAHTIVGHAYNGQTGEKNCMQRERLKTSDNETNTKL